MSAPRISIVVATRDRLPSLREAVGSLLAQEPAGLSALLVVDDGSTDGTSDYLAGLAAAGRLTHLRSAAHGPAAARNVGLRAVATSFVALTDDDCIAPHDWARRLLRALETSGAAAVGGRVCVGPGEARPGRLSQAVTSGLVQALNGDAGEPGLLTSNNVAYRLDGLRAAGFFDESFARPGAEERELHARLRLRGGRLLYVPGIVVEHRPALSWRGFLRQQVAYGRGARLYHTRARRAGARARLPSARQYRAAFVEAWRSLAPADRMALPLGFLLGQVAVVCGYLVPSR